MDGVLCLNDRFITDKQKIGEFNDYFSDFCRKNINVPDLDITTIDAGNAKDGRFLSYNENIIEVFKRDNLSNIVYGKDFRKTLNPMKLTDPTESRLAFNLEKIRNYLCFADNSGNLQKDIKGKFSCFQYIRRVGVKVCTLLEEEHIEKEESLEYLSKKFGDIDVEPFKKVNFYFKDIGKLTSFLIKSEKSKKLLEESLTCYETILKEIVDKYSAKSVRDKKL